MIDAAAPAASVAAVEDAVARRAGEFIDLLTALLREPSVNPLYQSGSSELGAQTVLAAALAEWGIDPEPWDAGSADLSRFGEEAAAANPLAGRPNLTARIGGAGSGRSLLLNSHIDVVAAGDGWTFDPFEPLVRDNRIVARGAADAKGSLAAMACAVAVVAELQPDLGGELIFESVVDEEAGGGGTLASLARGLAVDAAIVGEPTGLAVCPATRGSRRVRLSVDGLAAHPGEAYRGVNAIAKATVLVEALEALAADLDARRPHPLWESHPQQHVFNLNYLHGGGDGHGAVPDRCEVELTIGGTAAETLEELQVEVDRAIAAAAAADPWLARNPPKLEWEPLRLHASETSADHPLVNCLADAATSAIGEPAAVHALSAVTDMRHLVRYGGVPTVNFGPGEMAVGHGPDEALCLSEYLAAIRTLATAAMSWCGNGAST